MALVTASSPNLTERRRLFLSVMIGVAWWLLPLIIPLGKVTLRVGGIPQLIWLGIAILVTLLALWFTDQRWRVGLVWLGLLGVVWGGLPWLWYFWQESRYLVILTADSTLALLWFGGSVTVAGLIVRLGRVYWQKHRSLVEQQLTLLSIMQQELAEGVALFDPQATLIWANRAALPLLQPLKPEVQQLIQRTYNSGRLASQSLTLSETTRLTVQTARLSNGMIRLLAHTTTNDSENQAIFYERFLRRIVHDMRNPLAAIIAHSSNLHTHTLVEVQQPARIIEAEAQRLTRLVDSLLFDARLSYVPLALEKIDLLDLMEAVFYQLDERAEQEGKTLQLETSLTQAPLEADYDLLVRAVSNLVDNSLKYSTAGDSITLVLDESPKHYYLRVCDSGLGIPAEYLPNRIFEPLVRVRPGGGTVGSGLGLSIVKKIVELHQGTITVESIQGEGTTVTICLHRESPS